MPTIMGLNLSQSTDRVVEPLVKALSAGIDRRFQAVLSDKEHLIASAQLPQFKLNFLLEDARLSVKRQVLNYVQEVAAESHSEAPLTTADVAQDDDDLFSFMNSAGRQAAGSPVARQVEEFMESKLTSLLSLNDYSQVARAFVKANSTLPSSAAVERLFSIAGMILSPRRCKVSDKLFDKMVFLKCRAM